MAIFRHRLSLLERVMVQHAHPVKLILEFIGWIWGAYFLWMGDLLLAAAFGLGLPIVGTLAVWGHGEEELAKTAFGKFMLVHANIANLFFHLVGAVVLGIGFWIHSVEMIMWGMTIIIFGHAWGWATVSHAVK